MPQGTQPVSALDDQNSIQYLTYLTFWQEFLLYSSTFLNTVKPQKKAEIREKTNKA